jgi:hypothetical protein
MLLAALGLAPVCLGFYKIGQRDSGWECPPSLANIAQPFSQDRISSSSTSIGAQGYPTFEFQAQDAPVYERIGQGPPLQLWAFYDSVLLNLIF